MSDTPLDGCALEHRAPHAVDASAGGCSKICLALELLDKSIVLAMLIEAVLRIDLHSLQIVFEYEVHDAPDRVRSVGCGCAAGESFDSVYHRNRRTPYFVADSKAGFTTLLNVAFGPDGLLYGLELSDAAGGPAPGNGKVVRVNSNGDIEELVSGLIVPGGMTFGPDGRLYVADGSAIPAPTFGQGRILRIELPPGS